MNDDLDWFASSIWTDPNEDGEQKFTVGNRLYRNETYAGTLWRNDLSGKNYLRVKLNGRPPDTAAAGARITLSVNDEDQLREIMIGSNFTSQNPLTQVFGLGRNTEANIMVEWPHGQIGTMDNVSANQLIPFEHLDN